MSHDPTERELVARFVVALLALEPPRKRHAIEPPITPIARDQRDRELVGRARSLATFVVLGTSATPRASRARPAVDSAAAARAARAYAADAEEALDRATGFVVRQHSPAMTADETREAAREAAAALAKVPPPPVRSSDVDADELAAIAADDAEHAEHAEDAEDEA